MKTTIEQSGQSTVVAASGKLDFGAAAGFQQQLEQALSGSATSPAALIVDCTALEYVSSAGLRVFLIMARAAQRAGVAFALCDLQPAVREVFDLSGFSRMLTVHADRVTALAHASGPPA